MILVCPFVLLLEINFWPFEGNRTWEILKPGTSLTIGWLVVLAISAVMSRTVAYVRQVLPHVSILGYVLIVVMSIAFSPAPMRSSLYAVKLLIGLVGVYTLVYAGATTSQRVVNIVRMLIIGVTVSIAYCLWCKLVVGQDRSGFFDSQFKYGTYVGILAPLCVGYLVSSGKMVSTIGGVLLALGASLSTSTFGGFLAVQIGVMAAVLFVKRDRLRVLVVVGGATAVALVMAMYLPAATGVRQDAAMLESGGDDCKQRYIEWQALLNLIEKRPIVGTGAGAVNAYRSEYYYRLPKLNTLAPFDQNGWLVTAAEGGVLALVCLLSGIAYYFRGLWQHIGMRDVSSPSYRCAVGLLCSIVSLCVANLFCSFTYNGLITVFATILALSGATLRIGQVASRFHIVKESCDA